MFGKLGGARVVALSGRTHYYEGHSAACLAIPTRVLVSLGAEMVVVTSSAGGVVDPPGSIVVISDHINLLPDNPLRGEYDARLGARFVDMANAYCSDLRARACDTARTLGVPVFEGVFAGVPGPSYETPAEVRLLRTLGVRAVAMSLVSEVIVLRQMGARVLGLAGITNGPLGTSSLGHGTVEESGKNNARLLGELIEQVCEQLE